jgi:ribonuclease HI
VVCQSGLHPMPEFVCSTCQSTFSIPQASLDRYPGWTPKACRKCKEAKTSGEAAGGAVVARKSGGANSGRAPVRRSSETREEDLTVAEVLAKYVGGPQSGVFTDGASHPNPGPGGWGAVYVQEGQIVNEALGQEPSTTNNRMELMALIRGFDLVPAGVACDVWTDSQLCVKTINEWAAGWKKNGWKRKTGEIKNLELIQELYAKHLARPELELRWIAAHSGHRWNEYADALSTAYRRSQK